MTKKINKTAPPSDELIDNEIYETLKANGSLFPSSLDEVERMEKLVDETSETLPTSLLKPLIKGSAISSKRYLRRTIGNSEAEAKVIHEARAARAEGTMTRTVEERMKADRAAAQSRRKQK